MVYHALQNSKDAASLEDLAAMDRDIHELREQISIAKAQEKILRANLLAVNATVSAEDLRAHVVTLESEKQEALDRLGPLRAGTVTPVSAQERDDLDHGWKEWVRKASSRKKICMQLWDFCTDELQEGQSRQDLWV